METNETKKSLDDLIIDDKAINEAIRQSIESKNDTTEVGIKDPERLAKFIEEYRGESVGRVIEDIVSLMSLVPKDIRGSIALTYLPKELKLMLAMVGMAVN